MEIIYFHWYNTPQISTELTKSLLAKLQKSGSDKCLPRHKHTDVTRTRSPPRSHYTSTQPHTNGTRTLAHHLALQTHGDGVYSARTSHAPPVRCILSVIDNHCYIYVIFCIFIFIFLSLFLLYRHGYINVRYIILIKNLKSYNLKIQYQYSIIHNITHKYNRNTKINMKE